MHRLAIALVAAATLVTLHAAPSLAPEGATALTAYLQQAVDRGDIPGAVTMVAGREGVLYHEAVGRMNAAKNVAMTKDAIFNIASMTKPVTSVAILMLVDEGKLKIDDEVAKYLPQFANPRVAVNVNVTDGSHEVRPAKRAITIRHLLTHTSGIGYGFSSPETAALQRRAGGADELSIPLVHDPGEKWTYGASTRVLGMVVEKISGQRLDAFLSSRIFEPLGMTDTAYFVPAEKAGRVTSSHQRTDGKLVERPAAAPAAAPAAPRGDGGLYSTAADYGQFVRMLLNRGRAGSTRLLSERSARSMFENHTGDVTVRLQPSTNATLSKSFPVGVGEDKWGLGFQLALPKTPGREARAPRSGSWAGIFNTHVWIDPTREVGVILMMQQLPFYEDPVLNVLAGVEQRVYRHLKS